MQTMQPVQCSVGFDPRNYAVFGAIRVVWTPGGQEVVGSNPASPTIVDAKGPIRTDRALARARAGGRIP